MKSKEEILRQEIKELFVGTTDIALDIQFDSNGVCAAALKAMETYSQELREENERLRGLLENKSISCQCKEEDKHGETSIMCCNNCGLSTEDFWKRG